MQVVTYTATPGQDDLHPVYQGAAIVLYDDGTRAPVMFTARTAELAGDAAAKWYAEEVERVRKKYDGGSAPPPARRPRKRRVETAEAAPEAQAAPAAELDDEEPI